MRNIENKVLISVIVCTYNRCESLKNTLDSLLIQECKDRFGYEIIVIDNNSEDNTKETVFSFEDKFSGSLKYFNEVKQGLSYARNKGVMESNGRICAFIDDDAVAENNWLNTLYETFIDFKADCVGGKIIPKWLDPKPTWLSKKLFGNLGLLDYGEKTFIITEKRYPIFGCNMAFRKETIIEAGLFATNLGRIGNKLFSHEEKDLFEKMLFKGKKVIYQPSSIIEHKVIKNRLKKSYFRKWHFYDGKLMSKMIKSKKSNILGISFWILKDFLRSILQYVKCRDMSEKFIKELKILYYFGILSQKIADNIF